jgi:ABC-type dipeptide/oligopeptide/nickel transport system permease component
MIPVITIIANGLGYLFSGALLIETLFAWRGMGQLTLEAARSSWLCAALGFMIYRIAPRETRRASELRCWPTPDGPVHP